ncbi:MAG: septum formation protein Maf [Actinobacteria bacterium]|nr:septum formation protein Maf [Actinomycetota bacterium]
MPTEIVLASRSPRRREILERLNLKFVVDSPEIDETPEVGEDPIAYVCRVAAAKADAVAARHDRSCVVIAADTTVALDGEIFGQPQSLDEARGMIQKLSGKSHFVHTAVSVRHKGTSADGCDTAEVVLRVLSPELIDWYIGTGESLGKAGAYAVQGLGARLVAEVRGDRDTVVGLSARLLGRQLSQVGVQISRLAGSAEGPTERFGLEK